MTPEEQAALVAAMAQRAETRRPTVAGIEALLFEPLGCLDHGFVRVVDYMGDDAAIVQAARVSYGTGTRAVSEDRALLRYLLRHRHTSPFEMCELKLHVKMPIFVARQWIRHRTASVNEISGRYSVLDKEFYVPRPEDLAVQSRDNKQGRGDALTPEVAAEVLRLLRRDADTAYATYEDLLEDKGLARELARMNLPISMYTQWYWKIDLHNLLHFLALRLDRHAQYEIRVYAEAIGRVLEAWVPVTWDAFRDYRLGAVTLSAQMMDVVRRMVRGDAPTREESGLSKREWDELMEVLAR